MKTIKAWRAMFEQNAEQLLDKDGKPTDRMEDFFREITVDVMRECARIVRKCAITGYAAAFLEKKADLFVAKRETETVDAMTIGTTQERQAETICRLNINKPHITDLARVPQKPKADKKPGKPSEPAG
jgi:hypothetical protein